MKKKITRFDYINIYTSIGPKTKLKDKPKRKLEGKKKLVKICAIMMRED